MAGARIPKEELRQKITLPEYMRLAMKEAIQAKNVEADIVTQLYQTSHADGVASPESPVVVFINSKSGGRHGPELKARLQTLMGEEQVI